MVKIKVPQKVGRWAIAAKLGQGAFGDVYLVRTRVKSLTKQFGYAAMKVEERKKSRGDEVLRMEVWVLMKLQNQTNFCTIYNKGQTDQFTYVVMTLLGKPLEDIRQLLPNRRFSVVTTLRIGVQLMNAFTKFHEAGFIHRDVKPLNMSPGHKKNDIIYLYDFGLARCIYADPDTKKELRPERKKVLFRGTYRYCSHNAHIGRDQGRVDDLWGLLYCLVEFCRRKLPWTGVRPKESAKVKETVTDTKLFKDCPPSFLKIKQQLCALGFADTPDYAKYIGWLQEDIQAANQPQHVFEWQKASFKGAMGKKERTITNDTATQRTADSIFSSKSDQTWMDDIEDDDTLEDVPPVIKKEKKQNAAVVTAWEGKGNKNIKTAYDGGGQKATTTAQKATTLEGKRKDGDEQKATTAAQKATTTALRGNDNNKGKDSDGQKATTTTAQKAKTTALQGKGIEGGGQKATTALQGKSNNKGKDVGEKATTARRATTALQANEGGQKATTARVCSKTAQKSDSMLRRG